MTFNPVYSRWYIDENPVSGLLPGVNGGYSENDVTRWLTSPWDSLYLKVRDDIDNFSQQLNPETCDEEYLDFLAGLCGFTGVYWDRNWDVGAKRKLLTRSQDLIWRYKGSSIVLSYVLNAFNIKHLLQQGESFIIGIDEVGDEIGVVAWDYKIIFT
jgi:hypothetical protein